MVSDNYHLRPMPHMTSSRINSAPYLWQTAFMALKYPLGGITTPVVAPTTVSATTLVEFSDYPDFNVIK